MLRNFFLKRKDTLYLTNMYFLFNKLKKTCIDNLQLSLLLFFLFHLKFETESIYMRILHLV